MSKSLCQPPRAFLSLASRSLPSRILSAEAHAVNQLQKHVLCQEQWEFLRRRGDDKVSYYRTPNLEIRNFQNLKPLQNTCSNRYCRLAVQPGLSRVVVGQIPQHYLAAPDSLSDASKLNPKP